MKAKKSNKAFNYLQKIGQSMIIPISILPIAGLLLALGGSFQSADTIARFPILTTPVITYI